MASRWRIGCGKISLTTSTLLLCAALAPSGIQAATALQTIYTAPINGPSATFNGLTQTPDGSFYGTAPGTNAGHGNVIFRITATGAYSTVVNFTGPNGADPEGPLMLASDGRL